MWLQTGIQHHAPHVLILVKSLKYGSQQQTCFLYWWFVFMVSKSDLQLNPKPEVFKSLVMDLIKDKTRKIKNQIHILLGSGQYSLHRIWRRDCRIQTWWYQNVFEKIWWCKEWRIWQKKMLKLAGIWRAPTWIGTRQIQHDYSIPSL